MNEWTDMPDKDIADRLRAIAQKAQIIYDLSQSSVDLLEEAANRIEHKGEICMNMRESKYE